MKYCDICGSINLKENNFCIHCGCEFVSENICPHCGSNYSVNNSVPIKNNNLNNNYALNESTNSTYTFPPEMKATFEKMISQLDLVTKTIKIFDQRIQNLEGHITTLANRQKKGFVQKQPSQMGNY